MREIDVALVGASASSHGKFLSELSRAAGMHRIGSPTSFACGGFAAACEYIACRQTLDIVHIVNNTCLAQSDLKAGSKKLVEVLHKRQNPPRVVIGNEGLMYLAYIFEDMNITAIGGDLIEAIIDLQQSRTDALRRCA